MDFFFKYLTNGTDVLNYIMLAINSLFVLNLYWARNSNKKILTDVSKSINEINKKVIDVESVKTVKDISLKNRESFKDMICLMKDLNSHLDRNNDNADFQYDLKNTQFDLITFKEVKVVDPTKKDYYEKIINVTFKHAFITKEPTIQILPNLVDIDCNTNTRYTIVAQNITKTGFNILFRIWSDTFIHQLDFIWKASIC
jgi:hypothetical protein